MGSSKSSNASSRATVTAFMRVGTGRSFERPKTGATLNAGSTAARDRVVVVLFEEDGMVMIGAWRELGKGCSMAHARLGELRMREERIYRLSKLWLFLIIGLGGCEIDSGKACIGIWSDEIIDVMRFSNLRHSVCACASMHGEGEKNERDLWDEVSASRQFQLTAWVGHDLVLTFVNARGNISKTCYSYS